MREVEFQLYTAENPSRLTSTYLNLRRGFSIRDEVYNPVTRLLVLYHASSLSTPRDVGVLSSDICPPSIYEYEVSKAWFDKAET